MAGRGVPSGTTYIPVSPHVLCPPPNIFMDLRSFIGVRLLAFFVIGLFLISPLAFAQDSGSGSLPPLYPAQSWNPSNFVYQIFSFLIFGSVNMRSQAKDYVDVWWTKRGDALIANPSFLAAYVDWYRVAKSGSYGPAVDASIVAEVEQATQSTNFLGRLLTFFREGPDDGKARVLVNLVLSMLLAFGLSFIICLPIPPGIGSLGESGVEAFLVALISTFFLTWFGVTSKFLSLLVIILLSLVMALGYAFLYTKHGISGFYGKKKKGYEYPPYPYERGWWG